MVEYLLDTPLQDRFYVDIGAYDSIFHSNTLNLHTLGWKGVNVEANPHRHKNLLLFPVMSTAAALLVTISFVIPIWGIGTLEDRLQNAVGLITRCLIGTGSVKTPDSGLVALLDNLGLGPEDGHGLSAIGPNVLCLVVAHSSILCVNAV